MMKINQGLEPVLGNNGTVSTVLSVKLAKKLEVLFGSQGSVFFSFSVFTRV